ncbi:hypothetical protein [Pedobacter punctiformis]|uniref:Uncharacterized protein n=1 Tax=Pedobacter punctiformis TaxID=3004097 RepID=A0ABT4L8R5_9SPHI|nr:hypothetical protein [Pedobacter sp. HCMS5-2]MCZ4244241.1 hypothetical protein [Pedobacter sp. HCMS5-2]
MEQTLIWRKGLFDSNYQVYAGGLLKFSLSFSSWKNSAIATTKEGIFLLKSNSLSNSETIILNNKSEILGRVVYDLLSFKATIILSTGEQFDWSYQNSWLSRWTLNNRSDKQIIFSSSSGSGIINSNINEDLLLIIGLYVREYYSRLISLFIIAICMLCIFRGVF